MAEFRVESFSNAHTAAWERFIANSPNATLFHDLGFLAYHEENPPEFHHLIVWNGREMAAAVPGGIVEKDGRREFVSPLGASVGGPALANRSTFGDTSEIIRALQDFAAAKQLDGMRLTLPPEVYSANPNQTLSFILHKSGFRLTERKLCFTIPVSGKAPNELFRSSKRQGLTAANKAGLAASFGGEELFDAFLPLFDETYIRHGSAPTHTSSEIRRILKLVPNRAEFCVVFEQGIPVAALFVLGVSSTTLNTFYICSTRSRPTGSPGVIFAIAELIERAKQQNRTYVDLGPSASTSSENSGVILFKEGLGAVGQTRDKWLWSRENTAPNAE